MAPISQESPCGSDSRQDFSLGSLYLKIKDARSDARRLERAIETDGEGPSPLSLWEVVFETGQEILSTQSKDLEIAAWLAEAMVRLHGLDGFSKALSLSRQLVDAYWDQIFPLPDEDGFEARVAPFTGLNGVNDDSPVVQCIRRLPITSTGEGFGLWDYQKAVELEKVSDPSVRAEKISAGVITLDKFNQAIALTSGQFYIDLLQSVARVKESLNDLYEVFYARVGSDAPPAGGLRKALDEIDDAVNLFARDKMERALHAETELVDIPKGDAATSSEERGSGATPGQSSVTNREEAFGQLLKVAGYFRKNEPHSPVSYVLEELVRRGRMSLPELLDELIIDGEARKYYLIASGMNVPKDRGGSDGASEG